MDALIKHYPDGIFATAFADPPYFLSYDGTFQHGGKLAKVNATMIEGAAKRLQLAANALRWSSVRQ